MTFGWARGAAALAMVAALAACDRGPPMGDQVKAENARAAEFFLKTNAGAEGVRVLAPGIQYKVVQSGPPGGISPDSNDLVRVDYEGSLTDGTVFDSSFRRGQPAVMTLGEVVSGWTEALQHMRVGDEWILYLAPDKAYGEDGSPPTIPPNSVLVFRIRLLDVAPAPGGGSAAPIANG